MTNIVQPQQQSSPTQPATTKQRRWSWPQLRSAMPAQSSDVSIQVFDSVGRIDRGLLWIFEIVSSLAVVLLAAGLVTSQTNVQTHGAILTDNQWMQDAWAWTQNVAIDMSLLGAIIRAAVYWLEKEYKKAVLYGLLALLLLFTAFIVSDVEAMYQSLQGVTIDAAWSKLPLVSIEMLTSVRSLAIVLLLVAHATQYINWYQFRYRERREAATSKQSVQTAAATVQPQISTEDITAQIRDAVRNEVAGIAQPLIDELRKEVHRFAQTAQSPVQVNEIKQSSAQQAAIAQHSTVSSEHNDDDETAHITQQATQPVLEVMSTAQAAQSDARRRVFAFLDAYHEEHGKSATMPTNAVIMAGAPCAKNPASQYRREYYEEKRGGAQ